MKHQYNAFTAFVLSVLLFGCQKEVDFTLPAPDGSTPGTGATPGGTATGNINYFPTTNGSFWKYRDSASGVVSTNTMVATSKLINNVIYTGMVSQGFPDTNWVASTRPSYYLAQKAFSPSTGAGFDLVFHYLNDTSAAGDTWVSNAGQGNGFSATLKTTIIARGLTMTVNGNVYKNVIHTKVLLSYDVLGNVTQFGSYTYFIARGVGIVKVQSNLAGFGGTSRSCSELVTYKIN